MNKKGFWIGYIIGALLAVGGIFLHAHLTEVNDTPYIDLKKIHLTDLNGNSVNISEYSDKPFVMNYWATWCGPCVNEFPGYEKAKQQFSGRVNFIMISDEPLEKIKKFKEKNSYTFIFLRSENSLEQFGILYRPLSYFYNARGELISKKVGCLDEEEIIKYIEAIF
jgi:thiol-disulfide isomerase/thioredoxin